MRKGSGQLPRNQQKQALFASATNNTSLLRKLTARLPSCRLRLLRDSVLPDEIEKMSFTMAELLETLGLGLHDTAALFVHPPGLRVKLASR